MAANDEPRPRARSLALTLLLVVPLVASLAPVAQAGPPAPTGLVAMPGPGAHQINVQWNAPPASHQVMWWDVYHAPTSGGPWVFAGNTWDPRFFDGDYPDSTVMWYKVAAVDYAYSEGPMAGPVAAQVWAVPTVPTGVGATAGPGLGQITVAWAPPADDGRAGIEGYNLYVSDTPAGPFVAHALGPDARFWAESVGGNGVTRHYRLSAWNLEGEGPQTATFGGTSPDFPGAPLGLVASSGVGEITLSWSPAGNGGVPITSYRIYRAGEPDWTFTQIASNGGESTYTNTGLGTATTWSYYVRAVNMVGEGPSSNTVAATTLTPPSEPLDLQATAISTVAIGLQWRAPNTTGTGTIARYEIWSGGSFLRSVDAPMEGLDPRTAEVVSGLPPGESRPYKVRAENTIHAAGPFSNEVLAAPLSQPSAPPPLGGHSEHVLWSATRMPLGAVVPAKSIGHLTVHEEDGRLCFDLILAAPPGVYTPDGSVPVRLACPDRGFLEAIEPCIPRDTPIGTSPQALANASASVRVSYRWDESRLSRSTFVNDDVSVYAPATTSADDRAWLQSPDGLAAGLVIELILYNEGADASDGAPEVLRDPIIIPLVGQALAAAARTGGA